MSEADLENTRILIKRTPNTVQEIRTTELRVSGQFYLFIQQPLLLQLLLLPTTHNALLQRAHILGCVFTELPEALQGVFIGRDGRRSLVLQLDRHLV